MDEKFKTIRFWISNSAFIFCSHAKWVNHIRSISLFYWQEYSCSNLSREWNALSFQSFDGICIGWARPRWYTLKEYSVRVKSSIFTPSQSWASHTWMFSLFYWEKYSRSNLSWEWDLFVCQSPDQGSKCFCEERISMKTRKRLGTTNLVGMCLKSLRTIDLIYVLRLPMNHTIDLWHRKFWKSKSKYAFGLLEI